MALRLVIGRSGTGKTHLCFKEVEEKLINEPDGAPLIYIVPDQMTFHTEYAFATLPNLSGMTRLNVYSFSRFSLRVLERMGGVTRTHLTTAGLAMMLRKIIENRKSELKVFKKAADQRGFYTLLQQTISEFKRYCLTPDDIAHRQKQLAEDGREDEAILIDKLHDLHLIYNDFEKALLGKYVDSDDYLNLAASKIPMWEDLKNAEVYIDGFDSFTPQEFTVIAALLQTVKRVTVTLTLDRIYEGRIPNDLTLFRTTAKACVKLLNLVEEEGILCEEPVICEGNRKLKFEGLRALEKNFEKRPYVTGPVDGSVKIVEAVNRREEIEACAREILQLVRDEGYRYRDLAVLTRDLSGYRELVETIFVDYGIPFFIDQKRVMHHHPLIELIRSSLDAIVQNWRYEAVFRAFKTDLFYPLGDDIQKWREDVDLLENYALAFGIHGQHWRTKEAWIYREYRGLDERDVPQSKQEKAKQKELNRIRMSLSDPLLQLEQKIKRARTVRDQAFELYRFLEGLNIPEKMERLRDQAEKEGRLDEAREHDQVWKAVIDLLDQLVEAAGRETMSLEQFTRILDTGLDELRFALVPPALDQVLVGAIDRTRTSGIRVAFILGVNEGILPQKPHEDGLLSDNDREQLSERQVELAPNAREQLLHEEYFIYRAFSTPSDRLYLSYPLASEAGDSLMPSPIIHRLEKMFPGLIPVFVSGEPYEVPEEEQWPFVVPSMRTINHTASLLRRYQKGYPLSELWWGVYNWFIQTPEWRKRTMKVLSSRFYENKEEKLSRELAEALYGREIQASVSRMELFNGCPFAQFSSYGLRLKEREVFRLEAPDIGQLFHAALRKMTEILTSQNRLWADLTKAECESLAYEVIEQLAPRLQREILLSSARFHYLKRKLRNTVSRSAWALTRQAKASGFSPVALEVPFGPGKDLPPLQFTLPNGVKMEVVGRIDRVDKGKTSQGTLLRIIDYKSSEKDIKLSDVYYGLALQMLAYLDVVLTHSKTWLGVDSEPAGVLYFHVHNPMLSVSEALTDEDIEKELFKKFKMKGLILKDEDVAKLMDQTLDKGVSSMVIPAAIKKDGTFKANSKVASREDFQMLRRHVRDVMTRAGSEITDGVVDIAPYKMGEATPCRFCAFKPVCQFDQSLVENQFRVLKKENDEAIYEKMRQKLNEKIEKKGGEDVDRNDR